MQNIAFDDVATRAIPWRFYAVESKWKNRHEADLATTVAPTAVVPFRLRWDECLEDEGLEDEGLGDLSSSRPGESLNMGPLTAA